MTEIEIKIDNNATTLLDIMRKHETDKCESHGYDRLYEHLFEPLRNKPVRLLEIGIYNGASVRAWAEYFWLGKIFAIDIDAKAVGKASSFCVTHRADQANRSDLEKFIKIHGGDFDIIIDDGGHGMRQQQVSLETLWPHVKPGGIYVIEDLESSKTRHGIRESEQEGIATTLDEILGRVRDGVKVRKGYRLAQRPMYIFCNEAVAIIKPE